MSNGQINFSLRGWEVNAFCIDGKIKSGTLKMGHIVYSGAWVDDLLHGDNCQIEILSKQKITLFGKVVQGKFVEGKKYINDILVEEGSFAYFVRTNDVPYLKYGTKIDNGIIYTGEFDLSGQFKKGKIVDGDTNYDGEFQSGNMIEGKVIYLINEKKFEAEYKIIKDISLGYDLFEYCYVNWEGTISELPMKQILILCCQGPHSKTSHEFYIKYLSNFDGSALLQLEKIIFLNLPPDMQAGLQCVINNLRKYKDFGTKNSHIRKSSSCNNISKLNIEPSEYFTKDH